MKKAGFKIYPDTKVFVACPAGVKTGGTEVIHQLINLLQDKMEAYVWYVHTRKPFVPKEFEIYKCPWKLRLEQVHDSSHNILITPETCTQFLKPYRHIQKGIWWLSVDNYISSREETYAGKKGIDLWIDSMCNEIFSFDFHKNQFVHLVQSYYADDFLRKKGIYNRLYLSDYIGDIYFQDESEKSRKDVVLYNPKKGIEFTKKIISASRDIVFVPIEHMTNVQIVELMRQSKVYIDFGNHPGKDRLPREAAMCGMCVITGKRGAAKNSIDVSIPQKYKFNDSPDNIPAIVACIRRCLKNYEYVKTEFASYRTEILSEKDKFQDAVKIIFKIESDKGEIR